MPDLAWMAWTWQTGDLLRRHRQPAAVMTVLAVCRPETERVGVLRIPTTRGDRLFISLLGAAFIHLAWLGLVGPELWPASASPSSTRPRCSASCRRDGSTALRPPSRREQTSDKPANYLGGNDETRPISPAPLVSVTQAPSPWRSAPAPPRGHGGGPPLDRQRVPALRRSRRTSS